MSDADGLVAQFMSITGSSDADRAASYLEMSGNNLEMAVGLYMEHDTTASPAAAAADPDAVRAPDATQTMRLMDDGYASAGLRQMDPSIMMMNAMMEEEFMEQSAFAAVLDPRAAVDAAEMKDDSDENSDDDDEVQVVAPARLSDMFAPPTHLIHKAGGFAGARASAKDSRRWLLVNIQKDSEFASHALNRDVWRDELVENLIRSGFIFWQTMDTTSEGRTYVQRYQVNDFPHVAIIDPRTGRLLWRKEGWTQVDPLRADTFAEMAMDFCSRNSFDRPPQAPRPGNKRPVQELSEDEQLQAAMRASMQEQDDNNDDDDQDEYVMDDDDDDEVEVMDPPDSKPAATPSFRQELLALTVPDEPASGGARLQFRMPDGKRLVRKFAPTDTVRLLYAFVTQTVPDDVVTDVVLMAGFPPRDLRDDLDKTVDEFAGQAITVRWKEE